MIFNHVFSGLPVADLAAARAWYERLLGRPPDLIPNDDEVAWLLAGTAWIYVVTDPERAGRALLTLLVDDIDALVAELEQRGIGPVAREDIPGAVRKAIVTDPAGNRITFGAPQA